MSVSLQGVSRSYNKGKSEEDSVQAYLYAILSFEGRKRGSHCSNLLNPQSIIMAI